MFHKTPWKLLNEDFSTRKLHGDAFLEWDCNFSGHSFSGECEQSFVWGVRVQVIIWGVNIPVLVLSCKAAWYVFSQSVQVLRLDYRLVSSEVFAWLIRLPIQSGALLRVLTGPPPHAWLLGNHKSRTAWLLRNHKSRTAVQQHANPPSYKAPGHYCRKQKWRYLWLLWLPLWNGVLLDITWNFFIRMLLSS